MASPVTISNLTPVSEPRQEQPTAPAEDYTTIEMVLDIICALPSVQDLLADLGAKRQRVGLKGYNPLTMFRLFLARYMVSERYVVRFIRRLEMTPRLREVCALTGSIPAESTFSRVFKEIAKEPVRLESAHSEIVELLRVHFPQLGQRVSVDSTDIQGWSNPKRSEPSDPSAAWGVRTAKSHSTNSKGGKKATEYFYGYKAHCLCDSIFGIPLSNITLPANENDSPQLQKVLQKAQDTYK